MQSFTIRDIENLTGIKAHTLRIWEQRYSFLKPQRKESKHRFYNNEDLKQLLCISYLYHNGYKISRIATLSPEEITEKVNAIGATEIKYETITQKLLIAAIDFNEAEFLRFLNEMIEEIGFEKCITEVCYPYLVKVGLLWDTNNIIPAQEHFSSYIIQRKITAETE
jgi:DNA-binding transcriptional MerR regulator